MYLQYLKQEHKAEALSLSLQDLLDDRSGKKLTDYVSVSISKLEDQTKITLTTTHNQPVSYITVIPVVSSIDLQSLVFVIQSPDGEFNN